MKLLAYHRDTEGRLWGPFTPGQTTGLLNQGVLTNDSEMCPLHKEAWCPLAYVWGRKNFPKGLMPDWNNPDAEQSTDEDMEHGERQCEELALHVARKRSAADRVLTVDPPPLPFEFDLHQLEKLGLTFQRWSRFDEPLPGIELRFEALDKSRVFLRCMPSEENTETEQLGWELCEKLSEERVRQAILRRQSRTLTDESPVQGPGVLDWPQGEELPHQVFILHDERPLNGTAHFRIEEWWAHAWAWGALWELEYFTAAVTVEYDRHWGAFTALLRLWPSPSEKLSEAIQGWHLAPGILAPPQPSSKPKKRREKLPPALHELCMRASDWAAGKLRSDDGWTALMMVVDAEGQSSATIYQQDSWEEAEKLAREELTHGHYAGNQMYVLARHVSWQLPGEEEQHGIMMQCEARNACPPQLMTRSFDTGAAGGWQLNDKLFRSGSLNWSAYGSDA